MLLLVIVSMAWLHFYYLPILGGTLAFFAAGLLAESWRTGRPWRGLVLGTGTTLLAAIGLTAGLLAWLDPRFGERNTGSDAFDSSEWRLQFGAFFRGYIYNKVRFPFERTAYVPYESSAYLTGYVLFGLVVVAGLVVLRRLPAAARLPGCPPRPGPATATAPPRF